MKIRAFSGDLHCNGTTVPPARGTRNKPRLRVKLRRAKESLTMKKGMMIAVFVSMFASGCWESYRNYGTDDAALETCTVEVTTNALDGATITVDDEPIGGVVVELTLGFHVFAATAPGYFPASAVVDVTSECVPVGLRLLPNLNGEYDFVLHGRSYYRFTMQIRQDENSEIFAADAWREGTPTSEHPYQHFVGTVSFDREVLLLSEDSTGMELWGEWTPPRREGVARIEGAYDYASEEGGDWLAESRPAGP